MGPTRSIPETRFPRRGHIFHRPEIPFQQETPQTVLEDSRTADSRRGEDIASFYRAITTPPITEPASSPEIIILDDDIPSDTKEPAPRETCSVCGLRLPLSAKGRRKHIASTAHLSKVTATGPAPLNPLPIDKTSYGYKVLYSQGWSERERHGIGAQGNEGRREPVKASRVKNDTAGLGIKGKKLKEAVVEKKLIESGRDIRERYEREQRIRKELMEYMRS